MEKGLKPWWIYRTPGNIGTDVINVLLNTRENKKREWVWTVQWGNKSGHVGLLAGSVPFLKPLGGGGGGTRDFKWRGWSNGAKSQDPKKSLGLPAKPKKISGPKINPQKIPCRFCGNSSDGKANWLNWSGWSLVHGRAPRDNADYCITRAM